MAAYRRDTMATEESETKMNQELSEGDRVTVEFDADLVKLYDDGSADVDADGLDIKVWPDELQGAADE